LRHRIRSVGVFQIFSAIKGNANAPTTATQQDVASGKAIFFIPKGMSRVYDLGVPLPAESYVKRASEVKGDSAVPVGAPAGETGTQGNVILGVLINEQNFVCMLDDVGLGKFSGEQNTN
jgi:hypothetical protein